MAESIAKKQTKQKQKRGGFLKGAATIATGGFIAKLIGALYRIPLTNLIGGHGIGLYQMVYPTYCLLLTVSATGIPSSIAKLTAERIGKGQSSAPVFKTAMRLFLLIGFFGSVLMAVIAPFLSRAQGSPEITGGYYALAPAVLLVSAISVFRGWFQGKNDMLPTALSEVCEQLVKVAFGLIFAYLYRGNIVKAVVFLLLAVSISELFALFLIFTLYRRAKDGEKTGNEGGRVASKAILRLSIPLTFGAILLPLSSLLDSVLAVRLMGKYASDAVALYGLFSGGAVTVINLPVSICYGIAAASVPAVAEAKAKEELREQAHAEKTSTDENNAHENDLDKGNGKTPSVRKRIFYSLGITVLIALPSAVGLYLFAEPAVRLIYRSLQGEELGTLVALVKAFSISALTLSLVQTTSACLTAQGKPRHAAVSMLIAVLVKTVAELLLLRNPKISVFGLVYATNLCYTVAFFIDLIYNLYISRKRGRTPRQRRKANDNGHRSGC